MSVFLLEEDNLKRARLSKMLGRRRDNIRSFKSCRELWEALQTERPELIVLDLLTNNGLSGLTLLAWLNELPGEAPDVWVTTDTDLNWAKEAASRRVRHNRVKCYDKQSVMGNGGFECSTAT